MAKKVLALYRGRLSEQRGTPIRIRSLMRGLEASREVELTVASWDAEVSGFASHIPLTNRHLDDLMKLYRAVKEKKIDVVVGHTTSSSYFLIPLKLMTGVRIVLEMHGLEEEEAREYGDISFLRYWFLKTWHGLLYRMCSLITTCSKSVTELLLPHNARTVTLCGGVDLARFNPSVEHGAFLPKDDRLVIGYAGNTRSWQGVDFLIDTFNVLKKSDQGFRLALLLSERKGIAGMEEGIEIYGPVTNEEVPKFLIDCDILVIPRPDTKVTRISFPSKIPEHLAMGKPVIASNTGDADQVIEHDANGLLYTPGARDELIAAVRALKDTQLRARLGTEAARRAQTLSWEALSRTFVDNILKIS